MSGVTWDYEEGADPPYYHFYAVDGPLNYVFSDCSIEMPRSPEGDALAQELVDVLRKFEPVVYGRGSKL